MVNKVTYIESTNVIPYKNLAVEEYLLLHCEPDECILYLWQNQHTIVIGRNQNAWKECLVSKLEEDGGHLTRRLSGGGAVYHDLGNLNFTFLVDKKNYNVDKQLEVIIKAVKKLGIDAEKSGRNDVLADGKKFSGNAFYEQGSHCYHHGTLMVHVNLGELSKYLTVSKDKLKSKGVDSVKSRVTNLTEFAPEMTIEDLKAALKEAFEEVYGHKAKTITTADLNQEELRKSEERFSSWEWLYGRKLEFQYELSNRFSWGGLSIQLQVDAGKISDAAAYSDSLKPEFVDQIPKLLAGTRYDRESICEALAGIACFDAVEEEMKKDLNEWMRTVDL
jgi:lipoate-protein ligase A